ncbi:MAG: sulfatase [Clostridia bacterium]|nr:sulfatase [Clostridia bacterium]
MNKPNILFICSDQHRKAAMSLWQQDEYKNAILGDPDPVYTPNLDALADEGILISEAYSSYPVCSPFRAMLFSGRYPESNGVWQNCAPGRPDELRGDIPTFTDVLASDGYSVGYVGKWHLEEPKADFDINGSYIKDESDYTGERFYADGSEEAAPTCWDTLIPEGRQRGIDYLYAYNTYDVFRYSENDHRLKRPRLWDKEYVRHSPPAGVWSPDFETDIAVRFIKNEGGVRSGDKPYALFVCYNPPHSPYGSREDTDYDAYDRLYSGGDEVLPRRGNLLNVTEKLRENARVYFSHVSGIDRCVGRLLDALRESGDEKNTIVVYTSDHGEMMGSHGLMAKNVPYEEATAIPFLIRYPGVLRHRTEPMLITAPDIMPTVLSLADVKCPDGIEGEDYSRLLMNGEGERPRSALFVQQKRKGVRTSKYLMTVTYKNEEDFGEPMLFDLQADPYQTEPLPFDAIPSEDMLLLRSELGYWLARSSDPWYKRRLYSDFIIYPS